VKSPTTFRQKLGLFAAVGFSLAAGATAAVLVFSMWAHKRALVEIAGTKEKLALIEAPKDWQPVIRDGNPIHLRTRHKSGTFSYRLTISSASRPTKAVAFALKDRADFTLWSGVVEADQLSPEDPDSRITGWFFEGEGRGDFSASQYREASKLALWTVD
jgi:hypothetical protein